MPSDADRTGPVIPRDDCDHQYRWRRAQQAYMDAVLTGRTVAYPWHIHPTHSPWRDGYYCSGCCARAPEDMVPRLAAEGQGRSA